MTSTIAARSRSGNASAPGGRKERPSARRARRRETIAALAFVAPALVGFLTFYLAPAIRGTWFSLTDYDFFSPGSFVGIENYTRLLTDGVFYTSLMVTVQYVIINVGLQLVAALAIAVLMQRLTKSMVVRGIILLPHLVSGVVVALLWLWILDFQIGIFNNILDFLDIPRQAFFGDEHWAIITVALIGVWKGMGYTALLIFAGLQTIPAELYEAASLDGAGEWRSFWKVTLPLLRPVLAVVLIVSIIGSFQVFDTIAVTTKGGPVDATRVIYYYIYDLAFNRYQFGYASAIALVLFAILGVVTLLQLRLTRANTNDLA